MTSVARELGAEQDLDAFATTIRDRFGELFGRPPVEVEPDELAGTPRGRRACRTARRRYGRRRWSRRRHAAGASRDALARATRRRATGMTSRGVPSASASRRG